MTHETPTSPDHFPHDGRSPSVHEVSVRLGRGTSALLAVLMLGSATIGGYIGGRLSPTADRAAPVTTTVQTAAAPPPTAVPSTTSEAPPAPTTSVPVGRKAGTEPTQTVPGEPPPPTTEPVLDDPGDGGEGILLPGDDDTGDGFLAADPSVAASYPVRAGNLGGEPTARHLEAWNRIAELIPDRYLALLSGLEILEGDGETAAYVYPADNDPTRWILGVDISGLTDTEEFTHTVVHELGHLVTLNSDQVPPVPVDSRYEAVAEACRTYFTGEGCALDGSYMGMFADRFWNDILDEWLALDEIVDEDAYWEATDRFWSRYSDRFVSDYAATNPGEDMAETFAWFVLHNRPDGAGGTGISGIAEQKVLFMWDQPELVSLREQIRAAI